MLHRLIVLMGLMAALMAHAHAEPVPSRYLDAAQIAQLYEASCSDRPEFGKVYGESQDLFCVPRNYPWDPRFPDSRCSFFFRQDDDGSFDIFYGRFTANRPQAIVMYRGACEPNISMNGGMALFEMVDGQFSLVRYYKGHVYTDCVIVPEKEGDRDVPFCRDWSMAQGAIAENFGPVRFLRDGSPKFEGWFDAQNVDGARGPVDSCDGEVKAHHLSKISFDQGTGMVVLEAAARDPEIVAEACRRFFAQEYDDEDKERLSLGFAPHDQALIRQDEEDAYVKMIIRFDPKNYVPLGTEITDDPVP